LVSSPLIEHAASVIATIVGTTMTRARFGSQREIAPPV